MNERNPFVEAFCFAAIFSNYLNATKADSIHIRSLFQSNVQKAVTLELGNVLEERLLRAQGICYYLMQQEPQLEQLLRIAYEEHQEELPFVWVE